jgi:hypothetical protein
MPAINTPRKRTATEHAIKDAILADGGARFRVLLAKWLPRIKDAYRPETESGRRSHYGFSGAGDPCERALWLRFHWMNRNEFTNPPANDDDAFKIARTLRLFNRGHAEEARFLALLEMIGVHVEYDETTGGQERLSLFNGHAGSALDGLVYNVPDAPNEWVLAEFKTSGEKAFKKIAADGVRTAKPAHYVQMQLCMWTRGIHKTVYIVVNKNDDDLHVEMVDFAPAFAGEEYNKMGRIIHAPSPPPKISGDPSFFLCKFCDCHAICQTRTYEPELSCRSCVAASPKTDSSDWHCGFHNTDLDKEAQLSGCASYRRINI